MDEYCMGMQPVAGVRNQGAESEWFLLTVFFIFYEFQLVHTTVDFLKSLKCTLYNNMLLIAAVDG